MGISVSKLQKTFGEHKVLCDLNMELEDDGIYCLMGASGMGKTTLLRIIMELETSDGGTITGIQLGEISAMFQEDRLCEMLTPVENVALVYPEKASRKKIRQDLEQILPADCMRQPIKELSGGMKRRVALARAMHYPSKLIILDEPFTGLDRNTKQEVISYILKKRNGRILLVATHGEEDVELLGGKKILLSEINAI